MSHRPDATATLFSKARRLDAPDAAARDRMRRAVLERAAMAGAGVGTATIATTIASAPVTKAATWSAALVAKLVVPLLLVGTAVTGAVTLSVPALSPAASFESPTRSAARTEERAIDRAPRAVIALESALPAAPVAPAAPAAPAARLPRAVTTNDDPDGTSRADLRDLQEVERLLARGDAESALAVLDARAARGSRSAFGEEIEGARVLALCASTRREEAARARATFATRYPVSPLARRIERACTAPEN